MKKLALTSLIAGSMLLASCQVSDLYHHFWPDMTVFHETDLKRCEVEERHTSGQLLRRAPLELNDEETAEVRTWLRSLNGMSISHLRHKPGIYLRGQGFSILFLKKDLLVTFYPDPDDPDPEYIHQVSRTLRPEDKRIETLLRTKLPDEWFDTAPEPKDDSSTTPPATTAAPATH